VIPVNAAKVVMDHVDIRTAVRYVHVAGESKTSR